MNFRKAARCVVVALMAAVTFAGATQAASAASANTANPLTDTLATLWKAVLQTPSDQNPYVTGNNPCWNLGGNVVAPFGQFPVPSCTVPSGTKIFVSGASNECSTFETGSFPCSLGLAAGAEAPTPKDMPQVTITGPAGTSPVQLTRVETPAVPITLPSGNLFSAPAGSRGQFVAVGWVAILGPLAPGTYTVAGGVPAFSTVITVQ